MRPIPERGYAKLAERFGLAAGNRAEGVVDGAAISLRDLALPGGRCVGIRVAFDPALDLLLGIWLGQGAGPRSATPKLTGDPELDGWVVVWGRGEVERADILLNSHLGANFWARARSVAQVLFALGPRPGWFSFGKRFKLMRGTVTELRRGLDAWRSLRGLATVETASFLNVSRTHLITGVRIKDPHAPPDLVSRVRSLVAVARAVHAAASREDRVKTGGPYR